MARPRLTRPTFTLFRRGAVYYVRWWWGGKYQWVSAATGDRGEASRFLATVEASWGTAQPPPQVTIGAILAGYLADRKARVASFGTLEAACKALDRHLGSLTPEHINRDRSRLYARQRRHEGHFVGPPDARRKKHTSNGTIIRELVTLRAALRWAVDERWITAAPAVETPLAPPPRQRWLTRAEATRLLDAAVAPHIRLFVALALYTAARRRALLSLRWDAVDLAARRIDFGAGMGNKRRGIVPICEPLHELLIQARRGATTHYVIEAGGKPVADVKTGFLAAVRRAGLTDVTPHVLRHTAATWMAADGVPLADIAMFLADSEATVERVYRKHTPDYLMRAARSLAGK